MSDSKRPLTYIMKCSDGSLYTGWTNDLDHRLMAHNSGRGSKYTKTRLPVRPVYVEYADSRQNAMRREAAIKKLTRGEKLALIASERNQLETIKG